MRITRPTTPTTTEKSQPGLFGFLLLENGAFVLTESYYKYEINDFDYNSKSKPGAGTYTTITRPNATE
jgi:hypothetical protein